MSDEDLWVDRAVDRVGFLRRDLADKALNATLAALGARLDRRQAARALDAMSARRAAALASCPCPCPCERDDRLAAFFADVAKREPTDVAMRVGTQRWSAKSSRSHSPTSTSPSSVPRCRRIFARSSNDIRRTAERRRAFTRYRATAGRMH